MPDERHDKLRDIFVSAVRLDVSSRGAFCARACGNDLELRRQLENLLSSTPDTMDHADMLGDRRIEELRGRLDRLLDAGPQSSLADTLPGQRHGIGGSSAIALNAPAGSDSSRGYIGSIGRYRLVRRIASGGMGTVYEAEQDTPRRKVALKMVHAQRAGSTLLGRLRRESEILGRLQHPGIAQVYDAGTVDLGDGLQPYFAMEYVDGVGLSKYCDREKLDDRRRLELLALVCDAVQYAHDKGVIHRDLKPENILVDAAGRPKVLDFGVARVTSDSTLHGATMTQEGQILGTLAYMAPEQMEARGDVTGRSDVYALGAVGFELLALRLPQQIAGMTAAASLRHLAEHDPPKLGTLQPRFRGDVETIIDKALQRDPQRRYGSAAELAADIRRYLAHQPIQAHPPSALYRSRQFVRRHKSLVGAAAVVFIVLAAGTITSTVFALKARTALAKNEQSLKQLEQVAAFQESRLAGIDAQLFGNDMRSALLNERRSAMELAGKPQGEIDAALASLTEELRGLNFTNAALDTLDENIFQSSLKMIDAKFADQPLVRARLLFALGKTMTKFGLIDKGVAALSEAYQLRQSLLGDKHLDTLIALAELGDAQADQSLNARPIDFGKRTEAQEMMRNAADGMVEVLGPDHPTTLEWQIKLARFLNIVSGPEAKALMASTLDRAESSLGPDHPTTIQCKLSSWNRLYPDDLARGMQLLREAWEAAQRTGLLKDEARIALLGVLMVTGELDEGETLAREDFRVTRERFGTGHNNTIGAADNLAVILEMQGKLDEAQALLEESIRWGEAAGVIPWMQISNLGWVYYKRGKLGEAESRFRTAVQYESERLGGRTGLLAGNLAMVLTDLGRLDEAERVGREALQAAIDIMGEHSWNTANIRGPYARALGALGRFEEAEAEMLEAHRVLLDQLGEVHERTRRVVGYLIDLYTAWHTAEPEAEHDLQADEWRARLSDAESQRAR